MAAIVTGLLWGVAPMALAQVEDLLATMPDIFVKELPAQGASSTRAGEVKSDSAPITITVRHVLDNRSEISMIKWAGTNGALRCAYSILFKGNTRICEAA